MNAEPFQLGLRTRCDIGIAADCKLGLAALIDAFDSSTKRPPAVEERAQELSREARSTRDKQEKLLQADRDAFPMHSWRVVRDLYEVAGDSATLVSELNTYQRVPTRFYPFSSLPNYVADVGTALGWGMGAAAGVSLARDRAPVIACLGDGAFLFGLQSLWTIANYQLPVIVVVFNNGGYYSTQLFTERLRGTTYETGRYAGGNLADDPTDIATLAAGFGIRGVRIGHPDELQSAFRAALESREPTVIDVPVTRESILLLDKVADFFPDVT
jgi:benzoylformate decarboxylase